MLKPLISKKATLDDERGVTIVLVALAMIAIISMAALSVDVVTLYLAKEEAQRSADEAALAAARILSLSGITGDPQNGKGHWSSICGPSGIAYQAAQAVVRQNTVSNVVPSTVTVTYSAGGQNGMASNTDCTTLAGNTAFGVNPLVTVNLIRPGLPTFFARIWGRTGQTITATATAEAFNPADSGASGNQTSGAITPVEPWCVKPWVVPNQDPKPMSDGTFCTSTPCPHFVDPATGDIQNKGITIGGYADNGVIGEKFWLVPDCSTGGGCDLLGGVQPKANYIPGSNPPPTPNLLFVPNQTGTTVSAVPSCTTGDDFNLAVVGCDQPTNYSCGVASANTLDLSTNPITPSINGVQCLTAQKDNNDLTQSTGQDYLKYDSTSPANFGRPVAYPFQILAGNKTPLVLQGGLPHDTPITSSNSIVAIPIYDSDAVTLSTANAAPSVTFVGFLQVFINAVDNKGDISVTVLNVAGCGNGSKGTPGNPVTGTSPVPIRLVTPP